MLTKEQKANQIKEGIEELKNSGGLLLADFSGVKISELAGLRRALRGKGVKFRVLKKRLLNLALKEVGVELDPTQFEAQTAAIFIPEDILSVAGDIYKFSREMKAQNKVFEILVGYDMQENKQVSADEFLVLAKLPSREILLAQVATMLTMPLRQLAYALDQYGRGK